MDENEIDFEVICKDPEILAKIKRALQFPEDLPEFDKTEKPTNLSELGF